MIKYDSSYWEDVDRVLQCVPNLQKIHGKSILITGGTGMILLLSCGTAFSPEREVQR